MNKEIFNSVTINQLKELGDYYKRKYDNPKVMIVSGTSSICTPCSIRSDNRKAFPEIIGEALKNEGLDIKNLNLSSVLVSMSWYLERILKHNLSVADIKAMQQISVDYARQGFPNELFLKETIREYEAYKINKGDEATNVTDILRESLAPLFFVSCGINDLFYDLCNDPLSASIALVSGNNKRNIETYRRIKEGVVLNKVVSDLARIYDHILTINDKTDLFSLGIYSTPLLNMMAHFSKTFQGFNDLVAEYNEKVGVLAKSYGATFIDISFLKDYCAKFGIDFHSTQKGHNILSSVLIKAIYDKKVGNCNTPITETLMNSFVQDNMGLTGMIDDTIRDEKMVAVSLDGAQMCGDQLLVTECKHNKDQQKLYYSIFTDTERYGRQRKKDYK